MTLKQKDFVVCCFMLFEEMMIFQVELEMILQKIFQNLI